MPRFIRRHSHKGDLHKAIMNNNWTEARTIVTSTSNSCHKQTVAPSFFGQISEVLPIHQACASRTVPVDFLKALILANPESIMKAETGLDRIPLHIAVKSHLSDESIIFLLQYYPAGARKKDKLGRVPLHYALSNLLPLDVVRQLIEACPDAVAAVDNYDWTPLHVAANMSAPREIILMLLQERPELVANKTNGGSTPLKLATESNSIDKEAIVSILMEGEKKFRSSAICMNVEEAILKEQDNQTLIIDNDKSFDNVGYQSFVMKQRSYTSSVV